MSNLVKEYPTGDRLVVNTNILSTKFAVCLLLSLIFGSQFEIAQASRYQEYYDPLDGYSVSARLGTGSSVPIGNAKSPIDGCELRAGLTEAKSFNGTTIHPLNPENHEKGYVFLPSEESWACYWDTKKPGQIPEEFAGITATCEYPGRDYRTQGEPRKIIKETGAVCYCRGNPIENINGVDVQLSIDVRLFWDSVDKVCTRKAIKKCTIGYMYDPTDGCVARCPENSQWDENLAVCLPKKKQEDCKTTSKNPVDFLDGKKYRKELIVGSNNKDEFSLFYYYDSKSGAEPVDLGLANNQILSSSGPVVSRAEPTPWDEFTSKIDARGFRIDQQKLGADQSFSGISAYWRHSLEDSIQYLDDRYLYHGSDGKLIDFAASGFSREYPFLRLESVSTPIEGVAIENIREGQTKYFDKTGRLRLIKRRGGRDIELIYSNGTLSQVKLPSNRVINFSYSEFDAFSIFDSNLRIKLPVKISDSIGIHVEIVWGQQYRGSYYTYPLISKITREAANDAPTFRAFEYNDSRWPSAITDIYDGSSDGKSLYAHFEYDGKGRAISSGLAGGFEKISVRYESDTETRVTNALGKSTTYLFDTFSGVKRLKNVVGNATESCAESNTEFDYNESGTLRSETKNGITTEYGYDDKNRRDSVTYAKGTSFERKITTCWDQGLNMLERIIELDRTTIFEYFPDGTVKSKRVEKRDSFNQECAK